jgi:signal transduction histidine kinase
MIFGNRRQDNSRIFTKEKIETAVAITGQIALILTLCSCLERPDEVRPRFQPFLDKIAGTIPHATLREVTQSVEHEINNPLSVIVNWSEVYREDGSIDPELRKTFQIIYDMSMRIMEVVRKLSEMQDRKSTDFQKRTSDE